MTTPVFPNPGCRVAVVDASLKNFLGFGVYVGKVFNAALAEEMASVAETIPDGGSEMAAKIRRGEHVFAGKNPQLLLDYGRTFWGFETWWGPEDEFIKNGYAEKYGVNLTAPEEPTK